MSDQRGTQRSNDKSKKRSHVRVTNTNPEQKGDFFAKYDDGIMLATEEVLNDTTQDVSLSHITEWLEDECEKEHARRQKALTRRSCDVAKGAIISVQRTVDPGVDISILERIRRGEGPRDKVYEDLLAPLRLTNEEGDSAGSKEEESYDDMKSVLLAWNMHVAGNLQEDANIRQMFLNALEDRIKAATRVLEIVQDEHLSNMYDGVGQRAILEPSERRLLQALHSYRPETAQFRSQNSFDMLCILWANIGRAVPDIRSDDLVKYRSMKVLVLEVELAKRFENENRRRTILAAKDVAELTLDEEKVARCIKDLENLEQDFRQEASRQILSRILGARRELSKTVLDETLKLTLLQAAQKSATWNDTEIAPWAKVLDLCTEADNIFEDAYRCCVEDVDTASTVASRQLAEMRDMHDKVLTRTIKFTGEDLVKLDEATRNRIIDDRKNEPVTALMMSTTLNDVLITRQTARQLFEQAKLIGESLKELLGVTKSKFQEYDGMIRLIDTEDLAKTGESGRSKAVRRSFASGG